MGQKESTPALRLSSQKPRRSIQTHTNIKAIKVVARCEELAIEVNESSMTCGWLLSEVIRAYKGEGSIVALKTREKLDILDEWLLKYEKSLKPFKNHEALVAYFAKSASGSTISNFRVIKTIGIGKHSRVVLARKKDTGFQYAIKVIEKSEVIQSKRLNQLISERLILSQISHPFIIKLYWAIQSNSQVYFVQGFCAGGELEFHLKNIGRFTENQAKFYFGEVLLALEYLHSKDIVYNNLKAENILLDIDGHIKLVDFSLAYTVSWENSLSCDEESKPEDVAVEKSQDFCKLAYLLYEMLTMKKLPEGPGVDLRKWEESFPKYLSVDVKGLLLRLLGNKAVSSEEIKAHPWCEGINWSAMVRKRVVPPFRPNLKKSNFNPEHVKISVRIEDSEGDFINNFDYYSESLEKAYWNMNQMMASESNVPSERNSTDAEDTFNSTNAARSLDITNTQVHEYEIAHLNTSKESETPQSKGGFKSLSPVERAQPSSGKRFSSIKRIITSMPGINHLFSEDKRQRANVEAVSLHIPNFSTDLSKMQECIRRKIT